MFSYSGNLSSRIGSGGGHLVGGIGYNQTAQLPAHMNKSLSGIFSKASPGLGRSAIDRYINDNMSASFDGSRKYASHSQLQRKMPIMTP